MSIRCRSALLLIASGLLLTSACGGNADSPLTPSLWSDLRATGAVIAGKALTDGGDVPSGVTVSVIGTGRSAPLDDDGAFEITDVRPGTVRLQFRSDSINATVSLGDVQRDEFLDVEVTVHATSADIVDLDRYGKVTLCHLSDDDRYHHIDVSVNAEQAHRNHGDGAIGDPVPADPNKRFNARCETVGPSVSIEKSTNGDDADDAPGPSITIGSSVTWSYVVRNNGTVPLSSVAVSDDQGATVLCPKTSLGMDETMTCTATGVVTTEGQYRNVGTVTAQWQANGGAGSVTDDDPSHYLGISPLEIEKLTNGEEADHAPGPSIVVGDPVTWRDVVRNIGTVILTGVTVVDDRGVAVDCQGQTTLAPGSTLACIGSGVAVEGQYRNVGTVTAQWTSGVSGTVSASDASHYLGVSPDDSDGPKVSLCHRTGAGFYVFINVSTNAEPAHLAHGDGKPGGAVPGLPGRTFTSGCVVQ